MARQIKKFTQIKVREYGENTNTIYYIICEVWRKTKINLQLKLLRKGKQVR